jgi:hypothetical protein
MRDQHLHTILPFLADDLAKRGGIEILPCTCPPGGPCLGSEDEASNDPDFVIIIDTLGQAMAEPSWRDLDTTQDSGLAGLGEFAGSLFVTEEEEEELERQENRDAVSQLGGIIDNMVYIVGMYTSLVQKTVEG